MSVETRVLNDFGKKQRALQIGHTDSEKPIRFLDKARRRNGVDCIGINVNNWTANDDDVLLYCKILAINSLVDPCQHIGRGLKRGEYLNDANCVARSRQV